MCLCKMKAVSNILLNFKLGCHKNNRNVNEISAMLKKYPNRFKRICPAGCFKGEKKNGRKQGEMGKKPCEMNNYTLAIE